MNNSDLIKTAMHSMRNDTVLNKGIVELLCNALAKTTEQRDAVVAEMAIVKEDYATIPEVKRIGWPETPATDAAIASLRAEGVEMFALMYAEEAIKDGSETTGWKSRASTAASEYAAQLRSQSAPSSEAVAIARQFEQVKGVQS